MDIDKGLSERIEVTIGVGCQRGASLSTLERAIDSALSPLGSVVVRCLASHERKSGEPALLALARIRGWPLRFYPAETLTGVAVPTPSGRVAGEVGAPSVAEAAARLAAAGGELLVAKRIHHGEDGKAVTVAVARRSQR
ncbi:MAG: cobalamin biosynthesis protein [Chromatiales bacterium]|nr:cobalamin biosynthesis protein [Chromatiales bacterium]